MANGNYAKQERALMKGSKRTKQPEVGAALLKVAATESIFTAFFVWH
jgi:hypothetical protein